MMREERVGEGGGEDRDEEEGRRDCLMMRNKREVVG